MIAVEVFRSSHCKFSLRTAAVIFQKSKFIINPESKQQFSVDVLTCTLKVNEMAECITESSKQLTLA